ncbi:MAG: BlaI/MecI/CopY family transcriptional regulator [Defluviitaleaceae bacterium]|nr:BlaI/MecI/CopY family transcriptional regulator [Defluviitaleaceae bacterium]
MELTQSEERLANIIWREAPLSSPALAALALQELDWKKSTTYTVLKKLCEKGVFKNEHANISIMLTRDELISIQSRRYVDGTFGGSLLKFIASFFDGKKLTSEQADELIKLIKDHKGGDSSG